MTTARTSNFTLRRLFRPVALSALVAIWTACTHDGGPKPAIPLGRLSAPPATSLALSAGPYRSASIAPTDPLPVGIAPLEAFLDNRTGRSEDPERIAVALMRLAALYDARARQNGSGEGDAIRVYKRIAKELPTSASIASAYYQLATALGSAGRKDEAQQVYRSLVCHNHHPYPVDAVPNQPERDVLVPVAQDHDQAFWAKWEARRRGPRTKRSVPADVADETFNDPFPQDCVPAGGARGDQALAAILGDAWYRVGDWYFQARDHRAGPYALNRATSAFRHAIGESCPSMGVVCGLSRYRLAETLFKRRRYDAATRAFFEVLRFTDEVQKRTGDPGADFRSESYIYIAGSLTYLDFRGPSESDPLVARPDDVDLFANEPATLEENMRVAIQRVQDPELIPQDRPWSVNLYKALVDEFKDLHQLRNHIEVSELLLQKWPMNPSAPEIQARIADAYEELARLAPAGTAERRDDDAGALEARVKVISYVRRSPWVDANKDDPESLQTAERLVRDGLQRSAVEATNRARARSDARDHAGALADYQLARQYWAALVAQDENASDVYESRFWLADALHGRVSMKVSLGETPTDDEVRTAHGAAVAVRDSNEDDKFLDAAAYYAVDLAFLIRDDQLRIARETNGRRGLVERAELLFSGKGAERKVARSDLPMVVGALNLAQQDYIDHVPPDKDKTNRAARFRLQIAESYFFYGQFDEARSRFEPIYRQECGKSEDGFVAWERLATMSALDGDVQQSRRLAEEYEARRCAVTPEQTIQAELMRGRSIEDTYHDAREALAKASTMPSGPAQMDMWRRAATLYRVGLQGAPDRVEAPEAAMNAAYAYKQVGEYDQSVELYELFINRYGDERALSRLEKGDRTARPLASADRESYEERLNYLLQAHEALASALVLFFNYRRAAEAYERTSAVVRFDQVRRRAAAMNALTLYANMHDTGKMVMLTKRLVSLGATLEERTEADFIVARSDLGEWDEHGRDEGANRAARLRATSAMARFHDAHRNDRHAAKYVVLAAYNMLKLQRAAFDPDWREWCKKTIAAFEKFKAGAPTKEGRSTAFGSQQAQEAAEAEYALLDEEIRDGFDYDTGHHRYSGTTVDVIRAYREDARAALAYHNRLQHVIDAYLSPDWVVAARARQGSLYDSLRTGLYNARPPSLTLFSDKEEKILQKFENSGDPGYKDKADQFRNNRIETWRTTRDRELTDADRLMVRRFVESHVLARKYNISTPTVNQAVERLALFTEILGDDKLREYSQGIDGFTYTERMFLKMRPGIPGEPRTELVTPPLPVVPQ